MKLTSLFVIASSFLAASAFGVSPSRSSAVTKKGPSGGNPAIATAFTKDAAAAVSSPLFRDPAKVRGGAVPGWAAYNDALDNKPLITKAMTSLVGWALGDFLAQVRTTPISYIGRDESCCWLSNSSLVLLRYAGGNAAIDRSG